MRGHQDLRAITGLEHGIAQDAENVRAHLRLGFLDGHERRSRSRFGVGLEHGGQDSQRSQGPIGHLPGPERLRQGETRHVLPEADQSARAGWLDRDRFEGRQNAAQVLLDPTLDRGRSRSEPIDHVGDIGAVSEEEGLGGRRHHLFQPIGANAVEPHARQLVVQPPQRRGAGHGGQEQPIIAYRGRRRKARPQTVRGALEGRQLGEAAVDSAAFFENRRAPILKADLDGVLAMFFGESGF